MMRSLRLPTTLTAAAALALSACTTTTCVQTSPRDKEAIGKWNVMITNIEPQYVCNPEGITLPPKLGQRVTVVWPSGARMQIVQPIPDRYQLLVNHGAWLVEDGGRLWVQPFDFPMPPGFDTKLAERQAVPEQSKVRLDLPVGWSPKPVTDEMRRSDIIFAARNVTFDLGAELRAYRRLDITELKAFAGSMQSAVASRLDKPKLSAVEPVTIGGRVGMRFEVEGTLRKPALDIGYVGTLIQGEKEIAYLVAWASASAFPTTKESLAHLADSITGL